MTVMELLRSEAVFLISTTFVFSLLVGSFLNVVIYRFPKSLEHQWNQECKEHLGLEPDANPKPPSLIWARSHCPKCNHKIKAWENIPVISYVFLRGKCSNCKTPISHRYWMIELLTAILSSFVVYKFGWSVASVAGVFLTWYLIAIAMIDYDTMLIPDQLSLPLLWIGLFISLWVVFIDPPSSIKGALLGYLSLWSVFHLFKLITGKEGMGYGDFKLLAAGGAWLGMKSVAIIIILSSFAGAALGSIAIALSKNKQSKPIPFGPYLAAGTWLTMIYGEFISKWYFNISGM